MATDEMMLVTDDPLLDLVPVPGQKTMMWADYLVFALILVGYIGVGLYQAFVAKKPKSAKEFINASGEIMVNNVVTFSYLINYTVNCLYDEGCVCNLNRALTILMKAAQRASILRTCF